MPVNLFDEDESPAVNLFEDEAPAVNLFEDERIGSRNNENEIINYLMKSLMNSSSLIRGAGESLINTPAQIANLFLPKKHELKLLKSYPQNTLYDLGAIGGDTLGFLGGAAPLNAVRKGAESLPMIGELAKKLGGEGLPGMARRALGAAGFGAVKSEDNAMQDALISGGLSAALESLFKTPGLFKKLAPTQLFRGKLTPEELKKNLEIAEGTNTTLGEVIGSPVLKRLHENVFTKIPFTGAEDALLSTGVQVKNKGENIFKDLYTGELPENLGATIQNELKNVYKDSYGKKTRYWDLVDKAADRLGVKIPRENLSEKSLEILSNITKSPELIREMPKSVLNDFKEIAANKGDESLKFSKIYKSVLEDKAKKFSLSGDSFLASQYKELAKVLDNDILGTIKKNPELSEKFERANKYHAQAYAPFLDKDIKTFLRKGGNPDKILQKFLPTGSYDQPKMAAKLQERLKGRPEEKLLGYGFLERAMKDGDLDVQKMMRLYRSLGDKQKKVIFPQKVINQLNDYSKLVKMNPKALKIMENPNTGQVNLDKLLLTLPQQAFGALGALAGGVPGLISGLTGAALPSVVGKHITKKLTSPKYRKEFVKKMIQNDSNPVNSSNLPDPLVQALAQALAAQ